MTYESVLKYWFGVDDDLSQIKSKNYAGNNFV